MEWLSREAVLERRPRGPVQSVDRPALIRRWAQDYEVLTSNDARSYLETVVGEMLAGVHPYLLPLEAVVTARRTPERPIPDIVAAPAASSTSHPTTSAPSAANSRAIA